MYPYRSKTSKKIESSLPVVLEDLMFPDAVNEFKRHSKRSMKSVAVASTVGLASFKFKSHLKHKVSVAASLSKNVTLQQVGYVNLSLLKCFLKTSQLKINT